MFGDMSTTTMEPRPGPTFTRSTSLDLMSLVHQVTIIVLLTAILMWVVAKVSSLVTGSYMQRPMKMGLTIILTAMHSMIGIRMSVWVNMINCVQELHPQLSRTNRRSDYVSCGVLFPPELQIVRVIDIVDRMVVTMFVSMLYSVRKE